MSKLEGTVDFEFKIPAGATWSTHVSTMPREWCDFVLEKPNRVWNWDEKMQKINAQVFVCMYVCMCVCTCMYALCVCVCMYVVHVCINVFFYMLCMYVCICMSVSVLYVYVCVYIHTYVHTHAAATGYHTSNQYNVMK
jgi:hypothetical protein